VFSLAGVAAGYWVVPEGKGESGDCIVLRAMLERGISGRVDGETLNNVRDSYDDTCR
jgi:hypothetical protein